MEIFEYASRNKLRFPTPRGDLVVEQLWDLPLQARDCFDLDNVAKTMNRALKGMNEESFVKSKTSTIVRRFEVSMEIVKHIIAVKLGQDEQRQKRAARNAEREQLITALADKESEAIKSLSQDDLRKRLRELDEEAEVIDV